MSAARDLAGRVILVTGASRGLGREVALAAARAGAQVVACGRTVSALESLAESVAGEAVPEPVLLPVNLEGATLDHYLETAELLRERFGVLDGVVLNAAMLGDLTPLGQYDPLLWARVFQVNLHSAFLMLQAYGPLLNEAVDPAVVFTLDDDQRNARAHRGAYAASKQALAAMMRTYASECESAALRVHAVAPPPMATGLRATAYPGEDPASVTPPANIAPHYVTLLGTQGQARRGQILRPEAAH